MTKKYGIILIIFFICVNLYWVFALPLLPFIDLPFHLAESFVVKNFSKEGYLFSTYYSIPTFLKSNTFHTFFCASGLFPDVETGNKIYYALYIILLPSSVYFLIRTLKGNGYYALLSFLFIINHNVHWGFTGYMMSTVVLIYLFALFFKYFAEGKSYFAYVIAPLFLILFMLHFQSAIFAILVFSILHIFYRYKSLKSWLINIAVVIPVIAVMVYAYAADSQGGGSLSVYLIRYYVNEYFVTLPARFGIFFILDNFFMFAGIKGLIYAGGISVFIITLFVLSIKGKIKNSAAENKFIRILLIISALCYTILPNNINGQNIIYERYSVIILLLLTTVIGINIDTGFVGKYLKETTVGYIVAGVVLIHSCVIIDYMNDFRIESKDFNASILPEGQKIILGGVIIDNDFRGRKVWTHFPMYFTVRSGGITTGLIDYKFGLIKRNTPKEFLPQYMEWVDDGKTDFGKYYMPADYLLVRSGKNETIKYFNIKTESGKWKLYRNILKTSP
ncbi:MAG: hypothetical protein PHN88_05080 [Ignavibacteria bacterium]|nr:hypothetical protein [Ignavibacteria bacterium]